jgi:signal peptidase I
MLGWFKPKPVDPKAQPKNFWKETWDTLVFAIVAALLIRAFLFSIFFIPSGSMIPTLLVGDRLIVSKLTFGIPNPIRDWHYNEKFLFVFPNPFRGVNSPLLTSRSWNILNVKPQRFEIMVFKAPLAPAIPTVNSVNPQTNRPEVAQFYTPHKSGSDYIKRVIGLPGDSIKMRRGVISINDQEIKESFTHNTDIFDDFGPMKIPQGYYFMMGDNRTNSSDSRYWGFLPEDHFVGRAKMVLWPIWRIRWIN